MTVQKTLNNSGQCLLEFCISIIVIFLFVTVFMLTVRIEKESNDKIENDYKLMLRHYIGDRR